jgi:hypothetical protein
MQNAAEQSLGEGVLGRRAAVPAETDESQLTPSSRGRRVVMKVVMEAGWDGF